MASRLPLVLEGSSTAFSDPSAQAHYTPLTPQTQRERNSHSRSEPFFEDVNPQSHHSSPFEPSEAPVESPAAREPVTQQPQLVASPVPFPEQAAITGNVVDGEAPYHDDTQERPSIDAIVAGIRFHLDKPMENLPMIAAKELRANGQCISLCVARKVNNTRVLTYYTGIICSVTKMTVVLAHVNRYTAADFAIFLAREEAAVSGSSDGGSGASPETKTPPLRSVESVPLEVPALSGARPSRRAAAARQRAATHRSTSLPSSPMPAALIPDAQHNPLQTLESVAEFPAQVRRRSFMVREAGSLLFAVPAETPSMMSPLQADAPSIVSPVQTEDPDSDAAVEVTTQEEAATATATPPPRGRNRLAKLTGSVGPLPFVTFLRRNVHQITFVRDPESCFYSLFQDPTKQLTDMQFLRMFVRRFLAHSCQGNNVQNIALRPFLVSRCGYLEPDSALVSRVAVEEMVGLLKVDRDITHEQHRRTRMARHGLDNEGRPTGLFAQTGVLFFTGIPQLTFTVAGGTLCMVVLFAAYLGIAFGALSNVVTLEVMTSKLVVIILALIVSTGGSAIAVLHTLQMRIPVRRHLCPFITRAVTSTAALALCVVCGVTLIDTMSANTIAQTMTHNIDTNSLCYFYLEQGCSGYDVSCPDMPSLSPLCFCGFFFPYSVTPCKLSIDKSARAMFIPLTIVCFLLFSLFLCLQVMLVSIWVTENRLRNAPRRRRAASAQR